MPATLVDDPNYKKGQCRSEGCKCTAKSSTQTGKKANRSGKFCGKHAGLGSEMPKKMKKAIVGSKVVHRG